MATRAKKRRADDQAPAVRAVIAGYEFDDQAIDQVIDLAFRMFERMLHSQHLIRALHLYNKLQKMAAF
jgi:hypothetical protein